MPGSLQVCETERRGERESESKSERERGREREREREREEGRDEYRPFGRCTLSAKQHHQRSAGGRKRRNCAARSDEVSVRACKI